MIKIVMERLRQGYRTGRFPLNEPVMPELFRGRPCIDAEHCQSGCGACIAVCPYGAIRRGDDGIELDMGRCVFCGECAAACSAGALTFSREYRLSGRSREDLIVNRQPANAVAALDAKMKKLFGRSLKLRQVSAGGCNACEADLNVLGTLAFDMGRFGIQFVASPRHADGLVITGPVSKNMHSALLDTWTALPSPRLVIAAGACAIGGGPFLGSEEVLNGVSDILPVDLFIPGCPPHPYTTLDGLLRLMGRIEEGDRPR